MCSTGDEDGREFRMGGDVDKPDTIHADPNTHFVKLGYPAIELEDREIRSRTIDYQATDILVGYDLTTNTIRVIVRRPEEECGIGPCRVVVDCVVPSTLSRSHGQIAFIGYSIGVAIGLAIIRDPVKVAVRD